MSYYFYSLMRTAQEDGSLPLMLECVLSRQHVLFRKHPMARNEFALSIVFVIYQKEFIYNTNYWEEIQI